MKPAGAPELSPELSIVIPCYNEEANVEAICAAVGLEAARHALSHEIILIDNCSTDRTRALIRGICARDHRVRAIFNNRNYGQMRSPTYAIYQAAGAAVIAMCCDFQDPPALIPEMIRQQSQGELRRARALIGPFKAGRRQALQIETRRQGLAVYRDYRPVEAAPAAIGLHSAQPRIAAGSLKLSTPVPR